MKGKKIMDNNVHKVETLTDEELEQIVGEALKDFYRMFHCTRGLDGHCQFFCVNKSFR